MKWLSYMGFLVRMVCVFALMSLSFLEVSAQAFRVDIRSEQMDACPGDPLLFEAVVSKELTKNANFKWSVKTVGDWTVQGVFDGSNDMFVVDEMPDNDLFVKVVCTDDQGQSAESEVFVVKRSSSCTMKICHQTTTGEYYGGTDFNISSGASGVDWSQMPPKGLEEFFSEQGIVFESKGGRIMNQRDLGVQLHIDDSLGVNPNNNFYVQENVNNAYFFIRFSREKFNKKNYNFTMRFYMILPDEKCSIDPSGKLIARTQHGNATTDLMDIRIFDDAKNQLIAETNVRNSGDAATYVFGQVVKDYYEKEKPKILRFEMVYYGYMETVNELPNFVFSPQFEQFPTCAVMAVDYISAEVESVCMTPRSACLGDYITVNAAGFARNADYVWKRYTDHTYTKELPWKKDEIIYTLNSLGAKSQADIKMLSAGTFYYSLENINRLRGQSDPIRFTLVGRNCEISGPGIDGKETLCVTQFPYSQKFKARNPEIVAWLGDFDKDYTFKWTLLSPDEKVNRDAKIHLDAAADKLSATLRVEQGAKMSGAFVPDAPYKVVVAVHKVTDGQVSSKPMGADTMDVWLYDQPNVTALDFVTLRGEDSLCAAYANDTILLKNKELVENCQWNFKGARMDANGTIHIDGFEKSALCNSVGKNFPIELEVVNQRCRAVVNDTFFVHSTDALVIDCALLSAPTDYALRASQLDTLVPLPIPSFSTSCDDDPSLNVTVHYQAAEAIHSFDTTFVLRQAQLERAEQLRFNLFAGKGTVDYRLVDGCGKSAACQIVWVVADTTAPKIACDSILDYRLSITQEDGCKAVPGVTVGLPLLQSKPLRDESFVDTLIFVEGVYAGRSQVNPLSNPGIDLSLYSDQVGLNDPYERGITYILWRYTDPSGLSSYCQSSVTVVNAGGVFSCESLSDIRSSVNENKVGLQYHYASAKAQSKVNPDTKYSLAELLTVPQLNPLYCGDVKLEIRFTGDCVDDAGEKVAVASDSLISADDFLKHRFPVGLTELTYRFITDNDTVAGLKDTVECHQKVVIASKDAPVPNDCPKDTTLYVDDNCLVRWNLTLDDVPTATIPYFKEVKYTYDKCSGSSYDYASLGMSAAQSRTYDTLGYPYMVRRISFLDENWQRVAGKSIVSDCENLFVEADKVPVKEVHHRNDDKSVCAKDPIETMRLKVTNFKELPACITDDFQKGRHIIVWYYDNGKGVVDSCVTHLTVLDTVPPTMDCGKWGDASVFYCDTTCMVPSSAVRLTVPSVDSLHATDNCTASEDLVQTWRRTYEGASVQSLDQPYPLGKTTISWMLTDESGVQSACVQTIMVKDSLPPVVDCSKLKPIVAYANERCEASADAVVKAGLSRPVVADDACSPTGDSIKGVGVRYIEFHGRLEEDGKDLFADAYPKGLTYIYWTFEDASHNKSQCVQTVTVIDSSAPLFSDCGNLQPVVIELAADSCAASLGYVKQNLGSLTATDNCDGEIQGEPFLTMGDSSYVALPETFKKDTTFLISWVFKDSEGNVQICYQSLEIRDVTPPNTNGVCPDPERSVAAKTECSVSYEDLQLPHPVLDDPCDGPLLPSVIAYVSQKDGAVVRYQDEALRAVRYPIGVHRFVWIYTDKAGWQDSCVMQLSVVDSVALQLSDCEVDKIKTVVLPKGECRLDASKLADYITFPTAWDMCDEEFVEFKVERRFNGELQTAIEGDMSSSSYIPLGRTDIRWIFTDRLGVMKDSCEKSLIVKTELFDCAVLPSVISTELLENLYATPAEIREAGLKTPAIEFDDCNAAVVSFSRSDGLSEEDNYPIGKTTVYWTFDYVFGDQQVCSQEVIVNDMVPPTLDCPSLANSAYECYGEVPAPYATFEAFQQAGGSISDMRKYKPGTFGVMENENGAMPCYYSLERVYFVRDVRDSLISCSQEFVIQDITKPVFVTTLDTMVIACGQEIPSASEVVVLATDNCAPAEEIRYEYSESNNRSSDPTSCEYNNYEIRRSWLAKDVCGNVSDPLVQIVLVVDTTAPKFELPADWRDTVLASNIKNCQRVVPPLGDMVRGFVSDACTESENIKVWQVPAAGTEITEQMVVSIIAEDLCGNRDSVNVVVYMDAINRVVSISASPVVLCGSDTSAIDLWSQSVRMASGYVTIDRRGEFLKVPSVFTYDCYRGSISESNLVYSNNPKTYASRFENGDKAVADSIYRARTNLRRRDQSDIYYFVAMDTITQCMDTTSAYMSINERPRVAMVSDTFFHCENDTLDVDDLIASHEICIDDMGRPLTKEGWMIGGVDYLVGTSIPFVGQPQRMCYFAENECGRSTSYDSYFTHCGSVPQTMQDSLDRVGSMANLLLWRADQLHSKDSILLVVNQRYKSDSIFLAPGAALGGNSIWLGDEVTLKVHSPYHPTLLQWKSVDGKFDGSLGAAFDKNGDRRGDWGDDAVDELLADDASERAFSFAPETNTLVYALLGDGVCPAVPSNVFGLNVMDKLPTAFTPFDVDGMNDFFMKGRKVTIFDRYGHHVFEGNDGWDGTMAGRRVDPGVYFYDVQMKSRSFQGAVEVVYLR